MFFKKPLLFFIPVLLFCSCKEEPAPPTVEILAPRSGFDADVGDTLRVRIRAEAVKGNLKAGSVVLLDDAHRQALPSKGFDLKGGVKVEERILYPIDKAPGGSSASYDLRVTVEDADGERNTAFLEGTVAGVPRSFQGSFAVIRPAKDRVKVFRIEDPQKGPKLFKDLYMDYSGSASSSLHSEFVVAGSRNGDLRAFDASTGQERWTVPNQGASPYPYFLDITSAQDGEWVLASLGTERLVGFRGGSGPDLSAEALDGHFIREVGLMDGRILSEQEPIGPEKRQWVTYYASTGAIGTQQQIPDKDIVTILPGDPGKAIVLANEAGQGKLFRYDVQGRYFQEIASTPSGSLKDGIRMGPGRFLLVHSQGLMVYEEGSSLLQQLAGVVPQEVAYEVNEGRIYSAEGKFLRVRDPDQGDVQWEHAFTDSVQGLHLLYSP